MTGVQTCALPISQPCRRAARAGMEGGAGGRPVTRPARAPDHAAWTSHALETGSGCDRAGPRRQASGGRGGRQSEEAGTAFAPLPPRVDDTHAAGGGEDVLPATRPRRGTACQGEGRGWMHGPKRSARLFDVVTSSTAVHRCGVWPRPATNPLAPGCACRRTCSTSSRNHGLN